MINMCAKFNFNCIYLKILWKGGWKEWKILWKGVLGGPKGFSPPLPPLALECPKKPSINRVNNYFRSIVKKTKDNINYSHKHYSDYLSDKCKNSFFIHPTNKDEIADIISSLDKNKSVGPYSIPNNILILLKNEISNPLADLFNLSSSGKFPSVLKIASCTSI